MSEYQITFRLVGDEGNVDAVLAKTEKRVSSLGSSSQQAGQNALRMGQGFSRGALQISTATQRADAALHTMSKTLVRVRADLGALFGYTLGYAALRGIRSLADGYTNLNSKIRTVSDSEEDLIRIRSRTFDIAQRTRTEYEATVSLYARLTRATAQLSTTEQERLRVTETINKAYVISGATVQEATNSIIQLTQSLAAGALRGEEFNSVAEQGPIILEILSRSLGKTRGELRAMSKEGLLTSEVVVKAILENGSIIDAQFAKMAVTIEGAATRVSNAWQKWIGEASAASGASAGIANSLTALSKNFDAIADSILVVAQALTLAFAGRAASSLLNYISAQQASVVSAAQQAAATRANAVENVALARTQLAINAATIAAIEIRRTNIAMIRLEVIAEIEVQRAAVRSAEANVAKALADNASRRSLQSLNGKLLFQQVAMQRMTERLTVANMAERNSRIELTAAVGAQSASYTALGVAGNTLGASQRGIVAGLGKIGGIGRTLFAAMGGWVTVVLGLAYALYSWSTDLVDTTQVMDAAENHIKALKQGSIELADVWRGLVEGGPSRKETMVEMLESTLKLQQAEAAALQTSVEYYASNTNLIASLGTSAITAAFFGGKLDEANSEMQKVREEIEKIKDAQLEATLAGWADKALTVAQDWGVMLGVMERSAAAQLALDQATDKLNEERKKEIKTLEDKNFELTHSIRQTLIRQQLEKSGVKELKLLDAGTREHLETIISLTEAQEAATASKRRGASEEEKLAKQQEAAWRRNVESQRTFQLETEKLAGTLAGPLAEATAEYDALFLQLTADQDKGSITMLQLGERMSIVNALFYKQIAVIKDEQAAIVNLQTATIKFDLSLARMTPRQKAVAEASKVSAKYFKENADVLTRAGRSLAEYVAEGEDGAAALFDLSLHMANVNDILDEFNEKSPFQQSVDDIKTMREEIDRLTGPMGEVFDQDRVDKLNAAISSMNTTLAIGSLRNVNALLGAMQTMTKEGSTGFKTLQKGMALLEIATQALALKAAISSILAQGQAPPPFSFAAMAAMAAAVAPLLASIGVGISAFGGGGSGPSPQSAEVRQAAQGTGTILGDSEAKSESIMNSMQITADATSKLVGINRGMLSALKSLQDALGAAGNQLARGAGDVDFQTQAGGSLFLGLFGGTDKIIDEGIVIAGGTLQGMLNEIVVGAYQTVHHNGGFFGSSRTYDETEDISDQFATQFQLIIGSIADTVREGALALGLLPDEIEAAMAAFQIEEMRISLEGLSAEEQQAEIAAVFSSIFDNLAASVVPFIEQFQQVGEGLGETLIRVATGVQVTQEAVRYLGFALDETDPEKFAQISEGLIALTGGIEGLISGMQSFVTNFAPDAYKFTVASEAMLSAFSQAGLTIPATADEMWSLMRSLDATTEQGREQIATLLRLSDVAGQYYNLLDDQVELLEELGLLGNGLSDFGRELQQIRISGEEATDAANAIARAQGQQGASLMQLSRIRQWTLGQEAAVIRRLQQATMDLIAQLYGGLPGSLEAIEAEIARLEGLGGGISGGFDSAITSTENFFEAWKSGMESLDDYLDSMLFGDLSALSPEDQLTEMWRQFNEAQQAALNGDTDALAALPQMANSLLQMIRDMDASGSDYNSQFDLIRNMLLAVQGTANPYSAPTSGGGGTGGPATIGDLEALYAARDALLAQQENDHRAQLALQLAQNLSDLAIMLNVPILEMLELQGVSLAALAADIGVDLADLNEASIQALGTLATTLGLSLTDLTTELGITLEDLGIGLTALTDRLGIDLSNLTVESTLSLANLAASLGANLAELSVALAVDLGSLADAQSLMTLALQEEINTLAASQAEALQPYLDAITNATNEADANFAIQALNDAVNLLAPDIRNQLAPYLEDVFPVQALSELDNLTEIRQIASEQLDTLLNINRNLQSANTGAGLPSYAVGTGNVPSTGPAMLHRGEAVLPFTVASWLRDNGIPASTGTAGGGEMAALREEVAALRRAVEDSSNKTVDAIKQTGQTSDSSNVDAMERQTSQLSSGSRSNKY